MAPRYDPAAEARRREKEEKRRQKERERELLAETKRRQTEYLRGRSNEAESQNADLANRLHELESLTADVAGRDVAVSFESVKQPLQLPPFEPNGLDRATPPPELGKFLPPKPGFFGRHFGGNARYERAAVAGQEAYARAISAHEAGEVRRIAELAALHTKHEELCARVRREIAAQHAEIDQLANGFAARQPQAVIWFYHVALGRDVLPNGFPDVHRIAYVAESRQLVVEREMPTFDVIPGVSAFRYTKARDSIESTSRPANQVRALYAGLVARLHSVRSTSLPEPIQVIRWTQSF